MDIPEKLYAILWKSKRDPKYNGICQADNSDYNINSDGDRFICFTSHTAAIGFVKDLRLEQMQDIKIISWSRENSLEEF